MSFETIMFKFATFGIIICSAIMTVIQCTVVDKNNASNDSTINILVSSFLVIKIVSNIILIFVCASCRTQFDMTMVPEFFERFFVSYLFLTLIGVFIRMYMYTNLTNQHKDLISYEIGFSWIVFFLTTLAYMTWTPFKTMNQASKR